MALLQTNPICNKKQNSAQFVTGETRWFSIILLNIVMSLHSKLLHTCGKETCSKIPQNSTY